MNRNMSAGQFIVRGSIWPAIVCGLAAIVWNDPSRWPRRLWAMGLLFYLVHVAAAFGVMHHWSHLAALEFTRSETNRLTGWNSGAGLYVNYAFTVAWLAIVAFMFVIRTPMPAWLDRAWSIAFLFLAFNGAIVFARPEARMIGVVIFVAFAATWTCHRLRPKATSRGVGSTNRRDA